MSKILLIAHQEFKNRVQKKSFVIATIVIPLIFPAIMGVLLYLAVAQKQGAEKQVVRYLDESQRFTPDADEFTFRRVEGSLEEAKRNFSEGDDFGLLYIPPFDIYKPEGMVLYTKVNPSLTDLGSIENMLSRQLKKSKMELLKMETSLLDSLETNISVQSVKLMESGLERSANSKVLFGVGMASGILMYMFIFIYGAQIMQGIIEEKSSKVVEIIVSSVRPFQLMMGKILGLASVGLLQFLIWVALITTLSSAMFLLFGMDLPQQQLAQEMNPDYAAASPELQEVMRIWNDIPFGSMLFNFVFYFLGGYLIYGALFAAVGSAVDSPAEAQQFMFPITIPMLVAYFGLFTFILQDPHGPISVWLSIIPFTSPVAMIGRVAFEVPLWQQVLSMALLIGGFVFTTWVAARIYRVGILTHGSRVNYRVLARWFMMRN